MKIGFSSIIAAYDPFDWVFNLEDTGFSGWEIVCEGDMVLTKELREKIESVHESTDLDLTIHAPFSDLNIASINYPIWKETIRQTRMCIDNAPDRVDIITVHPGHLSPLGAQMPEKAWERIIEAVRILADSAIDRGISISLENMVNIPWMFGRFAHEITGLYETIDRENSCITFDIGHAHLTESIEDFFEVEFSHIHAHDNHGKSDEHLAIGKGTIDWARIKEGLKDYKGNIVIEARSFEEGVESYNYLTSM